MSDDRPAQLGERAETADARHLVLDAGVLGIDAADDAVAVHADRLELGLEAARELVRADHRDLHLPPAPEVVGDHGAQCRHDPGADHRRDHLGGRDVADRVAVPGADGDRQPSAEGRGRCVEGRRCERDQVQRVLGPAQHHRDAERRPEDQQGLPLGLEVRVDDRRSREGRSDPQRHQLDQALSGQTAQVRERAARRSLTSEMPLPVAHLNVPVGSPARSWDPAAWTACAARTRCP